MDNSYPKQFRLLSGKDFGHLRAQAAFASSGLFLFFHKPSRNNLGHTRIGISVSAKTCSAVERNWIKRKIREVFRKSVYKQLNKDVVIVLNRKKFKSIKQTKLALEQDLLSGFKKIVNS
ncbi:MAG: ribonuclease P protein component [Bacteriovoracaceae bacterium]